MRKHSLITAGFAAVLMLGGCANVAAAYDDLTGGSTTAETAGAVAGVPATTVDDAVSAAKKDLTAAHTLHEGVAHTLETFAADGILKGSAAATAKIYLDRSEAALKLADQAVSLADAKGIENQIGIANGLIAQAQTVMGK